MSDLWAASEATWPPARTWREGPWLMRDGKGGGKRVSAASLVGALADGPFPPLVSLTPDQTELDAALEAEGYRAFDHSVLWSAPIERLADRPVPLVTAFTVWEPLAIQRDLWDADGIGPARRNVMARVTGPKTALLGRTDDSPAGVGFAAVGHDVCFVHALSVLPEFRRRGLAAWMLRAAAHWGKANGAKTLALICLRDNTAANGLYASLGMQQAPGYHYREAPQERPS